MVPKTKENTRLLRWENRALVVALVRWAEQTKEQIRLSMYGSTCGIEIINDDYATCQKEYAENAT